jgi:hypothetical protein
VLAIKVNLKQDREVFYTSVPSLKKTFTLIQNLLQKTQATRTEFPSLKKEGG